MTVEELDIFVERKLTEMIIKTLEVIELEIKIKRDKLDNNPNWFKKCKMRGYSDSMEILEKHISELKGDKCDNNHDCEHCDWVECPLDKENK